MNIAYCRVSTVEQNEARQVEALEKHNIDKWFTEKVSAKDTNRPKLQEMLEFAREGDKVFIHSIDRLARNTKDLLEIVELLGEKKVELISIKDNIDFNSNTGKFMLTILGAVAELERNILKERQREGIFIAKQKGKYKGRKAVEIDANFKEQYNKYLNRELNKTQLAKELNISRPTLDKLIKEYQEQQEQMLDN